LELKKSLGKKCTHLKKLKAHLRGKLVDLDKNCKELL